MADRISGGERVAFVGTTGSGKTYAAGRLLAGIPRLVALNPKGSPSVRGWQYDGQWNDRTVKRLRRGENVRIHVPPAPGRDWEEILRQCFDIGGLTIYIDEIYLICPSGVPGQWLLACYTAGREIGIGTWGAMQRPSRVPLITISESEWKFVFRLKLQKDRKTMADIVGPEVMQSPEDKFGFWMDYDGWQKPRYYGRIG